ncbi:beta-lactamase-like protein [Dunaliella salina]|uniref:Cleavage and polyadenylation specificity factor subunit 2 n=1 Tax=Dunaliella salina TaxID=3046 RepID=A0ABQ7H190_DUNSA|nr:beta-lactamase-like protein [Dunaliella salina]|eukprot:KAF5840626.1 beta-lactamase-like protein [Dunaliella salina]
MGCAIKFTPLLDLGPEQPVCGLLEIDNVTLLMNCGWSEQFDEQLLEPVISKLPHVDAVVLTHPDVYHVGALPYLIGRHGLTARIFSTVPVRRMGQLAMQELLLDKRAKKVLRQLQQ